MNTILPDDPPQPYAIYHATDIMAMLYPDPQEWLTNREQAYVHIANVYAHRSRIFALTNHTDGHDWTKHECVFWVAEGASPRSTSVGDVIHSPSTGQVWLIGHDGLQKICTS